ncbi:hypothetical protein [Natrinema pallidum]|uniref:Small CPxCG-related zinc finger protein n=2 Tax=Natrinema pallidum TaxID=69527 RepID=L9ZAK3_9EURY|nr:hypothetical protein [Natrinema pallidum]ELY82193.1 hypothetical protein C487_02773 [Natrinema pallidum DSM 3751]QCW03518.1 hypothetical protein FGF80_09825 [Natrinema pallidum]
MRGQENEPAMRSMLRSALEAALLPGDDGTVIEECRRCGTTLESTLTNCPSCGCRDIAEYRIQ